MIDFESFQKYLNLIEEYINKDRALMNLVGEGIGTYSHDLLNSFISLLQSSFNDKHEWIEWWIWECDFGKNHCNYYEKGSEDEISLSNVKVFYSFLLNLIKPDEE